MKKSLLALALSIVMLLAMMVPAVADNADFVGSAATVNVEYSLEESWTWHITPDADTMNITTTPAEVEVGFDKVSGSDIFAIPTQEGKKALAIQVSSSGNFAFTIKNGQTELTPNAEICKATVDQALPGEVTLIIECAQEVDPSIVQEAGDTKTATITFTVVYANEGDL